MTDMITLVVPFGAELAPICSHGRSFQAYLEDPRGHYPRWLVDVTPEAAHEFLSTGGGFHLYKPQMRRRLSGEMTPLVHADGPASVSFDGDSYESEEQVMPNGARIHVLMIPSEGVLEFRNSHPGFSVLSIADYQPRRETDGGTDPEDGGVEAEGASRPAKGKRGKREE